MMKSKNPNETKPRPLWRTFQHEKEAVKMVDFSEDDAEKELRKSEDNINESDGNKVNDNKEKIEALAKKGALKKFIGTIGTMLSMVKDYTTGRYTAVPWSSIAAIIGALLYVLSPMDAIPDFIPVVGLIDDATVVGFCLKLVGKDIAAYENWKSKNNRV